MIAEEEEEEDKGVKELLGTGPRLIVTILFSKGIRSSTITRS
jgi:hypothetical protein